MINRRQFIKDTGKNLLKVAGVVALGNFIDCDKYFMAGLTGKEIRNDNRNIVPYVCNFSSDTSGDNIMQYPKEFFVYDRDGSIHNIGKRDKTIFGVNEEIAVGAIIQNKKGSMAEMQIITGGGKVVKRFGGIVPYDCWPLQGNFRPRELYELGGRGQYTAKFLIDDMERARKDFSLT